MILLSLYDNILMLCFVITLSFAIALFPQEDLSQWAARKPLLRRIFDLKVLGLGPKRNSLKVISWCDIDHKLTITNVIKIRLLTR